MSPEDLIAVCAARRVTVGVELKLEGPEPLPDDLLAALTVHKPEVVAHLLGLAVDVRPPDPAAILARTRGADPKQISWLLGLGLLARRAVHATDPDVKARLEALIRMTPRTQEGHDAFQRRMDDVLNALDRDGKLPPV